MEFSGVTMAYVSPSWARYFSFAPKEKYPKERAPGCHALRVAAMLAETGGAGNSPPCGRLRQPAPSPGFGLRFSFVTERDHVHWHVCDMAQRAAPRLPRQRATQKNRDQKPRLKQVCEATQR
jgi:hypothetical protein